jgi:hypothetical protein
VNTTIIRIPPDEIQSAPACCVNDDYLAFASNLKRSRAPGKLLGSFSVHVPVLDLHLLRVAAR